MASLDDILTAQKNGVVALNRIAQGVSRGAPITPYNGGQGASLAVTTASSRVALIGSSANVAYANICNVTSVWAFVQFGDATVVATTASMAVPPNSCVLVSLTSINSVFPTNMAAITASGTTTLQVTMAYT
jgi:hypothetical protein